MIMITNNCYLPYAPYHIILLLFYGLFLLWIMFAVKQNKTKQNHLHPFDDLQLWTLNSTFKEVKKSPLQRVPRLSYSEVLTQPVFNFKNYQGLKCDWFYFTLFSLFIFSCYVIAESWKHWFCFWCSQLDY